MSSIANVLIVDDNSKYLSDALPMYGYNVEVASDGVEALKILSQRSDFDVVLLDVMMPNMDGWQTLKSIRAHKKFQTLPIIMLTAINEEAKQVSGLKFGADDYITKPFILPNLLARIEALLRRSRWQKENASNIELPFALSGNVEDLTEREREVLKMVAKGASNQDIAKALFVREVTVKTHLNSVFKKLKVSNRTQAVLLAMQMKIIED